MCVVYMHILHHVIQGTWSSLDFGSCGVLEPNPQDTERRLYLHSHRLEIFTLCCWHIVNGELAHIHMGMQLNSTHSSPESWPSALCCPGRPVRAALRSPPHSTSPLGGSGGSFSSPSSFSGALRLPFSPLKVRLQTINLLSCHRELAPQLQGSSQRLLESTFGFGTILSCVMHSVHEELALWHRDNCSYSSSLIVHGEKSHGDQGLWYNRWLINQIFGNTSFCDMFTFIKSLKTLWKDKNDIHKSVP